MSKIGFEVFVFKSTKTYPLFVRAWVSQWDQKSQEQDTYLFSVLSNFLTFLETFLKFSNGFVLSILQSPSSQRTVSKNLRLSWMAVKLTSNCIEVLKMFTKFLLKNFVFILFHLLKKNTRNLPFENEISHLEQSLKEEFLSSSQFVCKLEGIFNKDLIKLVERSWEASTLSRTKAAFKRQWHYITLHHLKFSINP